MVSPCAPPFLLRQGLFFVWSPCPLHLCAHGRWSQHFPGRAALESINSMIQLRFFFLPIALEANQSPITRALSVHNPIQLDPLGDFPLYLS